MKKFSNLLFIILLSVGCSQKNTFVKVNSKFQAKSKNMKQLVQRFKEYWNYFSKKEFDKAYYYELPYQRFIHSLSWYKKFNQVNDQNYTTFLKDIKLKDSYIAYIKSTYISSDKKTSFDFVDKWYFIDGKWYHLMKTSRFDIAEPLE